MKLIPSENRLWQFAEFYKGLSLLGSGKITESKQLMEKILKDSDHRFFKPAQQVLQDY